MTKTNERDGLADAWTEASEKVARLQVDLDITNADHIALWLEANADAGHAYMACRIIEAHEEILRNLNRKHVFWPPGDPDCPPDIKAGNGEIHTLRCKVCGLDDPRGSNCAGKALTTAAVPAEPSEVEQGDGPAEIWLEPECCADPREGRCWSPHAPDECDDPCQGQPTRYIRADLATPSQPAEPSEGVDYSEQALADRAIDFLEERADVWMAEEGVQRMFNAIASVFEKYAPQDIMDRFREQLGVIGRQCHVEGALRVWEEIAAQQRQLGRPLPPFGSALPNQPAESEDRHERAMG